jgi:hypothetical protein
MDKIIQDVMPRGITQLSTKFIESKIEELHLGQPFAVEVNRGEERGQIEQGDLITTLYFQDPDDPRNRILLQTDGFEVGYGGEGPCGLLALLTKTGMHIPDKDADPRRIQIESGSGHRWYSKTQGWIYGPEF